MKVTVKKYGRWSENCNWQLESKTTKQISADIDIADLGYTYNQRYNEYTLVSESKLQKTVVQVLEA